MSAVGPDPRRQILDGALRAFARRGYAGSTIREIAIEAQVSVAGLYHHFPSKRALLDQIMDDVMDDLIVSSERAITGAGESAVDALRAVVTAHVLHHIHHQRASFVGNTELRSLVEPARSRILSKRDRQRAIFDEAIGRGIDEGMFLVPYPIEASRGLVTMCTGVATWYRPEGSLTSEQIVERYCAIALHIVGHRDVLDGAQTTTSRRRDGQH